MGVGVLTCGLSAAHYAVAPLESGAVLLQLGMRPTQMVGWLLLPDSAREFGEHLIEVAGDEAQGDGSGFVGMLQCYESFPVDFAVEPRPESTEHGRVGFFVGISALVEVGWEVTRPCARELGGALIEAADAADAAPPWGPPDTADSSRDSF